MSSSNQSGRLGLIVVGSGGMGNVHAKRWGEIPEVELRAVASLDPGTARNLPGGGSAKQYSSLTDALADKSLDISIVDICTPTPTHSPLACEALKAGKHVLCEKPMGRTLADCDAIIEAAKAARTTVMIGHVLRFSPEYAAAKRQVDAGAIGAAEVRSARLAAVATPAGWRNWFWDPSMSGGVVLDMIIHDFDWLRWTFGPVDRVFAKGLYKNPEFTGKLDYALCTFHHKNGVLSHVAGSWAETSGFHTTFEICGDGGMITHDSALASPLSIAVRQTPEAGKSQFVETPLHILAPGDDPYYKEIRHFVDRIHSGKQPDITLADARAAVEIALAALKSIETGEPVAIV